MTVDNVSTIDGIRVLGSIIEVAQSFELCDSLHAVGPASSSSFPSPDQGHRIVRFATSVVGGKHCYLGIRSYVNRNTIQAVRTLPAFT